MALNHISLMGRLTRDPELRYTNSGTAVASFSIAVDRDFSKDRETDFINIVAWKKTGEFVSQYFSKGDLIILSGRLQMRDWTDREGGKRTSAEVIAESVYFGGSRKDKPEDDGQPVYTELEDDGELPF